MDQTTLYRIMHGLDGNKDNKLAVKEISFYAHVAGVAVGLRVPARRARSDPTRRPAPQDSARPDGWRTEDQRTAKRAAINSTNRAALLILGFLVLLLTYGLIFQLAMKRQGVQAGPCWAPPATALAHGPPDCRTTDCVVSPAKRVRCLDSVLWWAQAMHGSAGTTSWRGIPTMLRKGQTTSGTHTPSRGSSRRPALACCPKHRQHRLILPHPHKHPHPGTSVSRNTLGPARPTTNRRLLAGGRRI